MFVLSTDSPWLTTTTVCLPSDSPRETLTQTAPQSGQRTRGAGNIRAKKEVMISSVASTPHPRVITGWLKDRILLGKAIGSTQRHFGLAIMQC